MSVVAGQRRRIAHRAQRDGSCSDDRQLGSPAPLDDGEGHHLEIGRSASFAPGTRRPGPTCLARTTLEETFVVDIVSAQIVTFTACRACDVERHQSPAACATARASAHGLPNST